ECSTASGYVLVESLGQLVAAKVLVGAQFRDVYALDELARLAVLLAVIDMQILERNVAPAVRAVQHYTRAEGNQYRHGIADGRAVGDVAADGGGVADQQGGEARHQVTEIGEAAVDDFHRLSMRDRRADGDFVVIFLDAVQLGDMAHIDQIVEIAVQLGHPQADVGTAG